MSAQWAVPKETATNVIEMERHLIKRHADLIKKIQLLIEESTFNVNGVIAGIIVRDPKSVPGIDGSVGEHYSFQTKFESSINGVSPINCIT